MSKTFTELAIIEPLTNDFSKETVQSKVSIVSGEHAHRKVTMSVPVEMFRYYFWGSSFELITYNEAFELLHVRDVAKEDLPKYNLGVVQALTYNHQTHDVVASNGVVYNLDKSLFGKYCPEVCKRICEEIATAYNFTLVMITMNGAVIDLSFDKNVDEKKNPYRNVLTCGFVTTNTQALRFPATAAKTVTDNNEKLNQADIDDLIEKLLSPK